MTPRKKLQQQIVLALSGALLFFPSLSLVTHLTKSPLTEMIQLHVENLEGFDALAPMPHMSTESWMSSRFQHSFEKWFDAKFGARNFLVRLNNEILYRLFGRSYMDDGQLAIARHQVLYETNYVQDLYHESNSSDRARVSNFVHDIELLQDVLNKRRIAFVFVITPSKAALLKPTITAWFQPPFAKRRIYDELLDQLKKSRISYVDGHAITERAQAGGRQIFPSGGIHWNDPTAARTLSRILAEINRQRGTHIPTLDVQQVTSGYPDNVESDLARLLNRLFPDYRYPVDHAKIQLAGDGQKQQPDIIFEGTSFTGQLAELVRRTRLTDDFSYYFYGQKKMIYPPGEAGRPAAADVLLDKNLAGADAIVIENNEALDFDHAQKFANILRAHLTKKPPSFEGGL